MAGQTKTHEWGHKYAWCHNQPRLQTLNRGKCPLYKDHLSRDNNNSSVRRISSRIISAINRCQQLQVDSARKEHRRMKKGHAHVKFVREKDFPNDHIPQI